MLQFNDEKNKNGFESIKNDFRSILKYKESKFSNIQSSLSYDIACPLNRKNGIQHYNNKILANNPFQKYSYVKQSLYTNKFYKRLNLHQHFEQNQRKLNLFYEPLFGKITSRLNSQTSRFNISEIKNLNNTHLASSSISTSEIFERKENFPKFFPFHKRKIIKMTNTKFKKMMDKILKTTIHQGSHLKYFSDLF